MDVAAWNALLDNTYGPTRGANSPATFEVMLLAGDTVGTELPSTTEVDDGSGGTTIVSNGYARPVLDNDDWAPADEAVIVSDPVEFGPPTAAWETANFVALRDPLTGTVWNIRPLTEPLIVTGAGSSVLVQVSVAAGGTFEG